jgi:hypothetical protein
LLQVNARELARIELEHAFLTGEPDQVSAVHVSHGTSYIELGVSNGGLTTHTSSSSLRRVEILLKLDAEGFDCAKLFPADLNFSRATNLFSFFEY